MFDVGLAKTYATLNPEPIRREAYCYLQLGLLKYILTIHPSMQCLHADTHLHTPIHIYLRAYSTEQQKQRRGSEGYFSQGTRIKSDKREDGDPRNQEGS